MGAWGLEPWDNDAAGDWFYEVFPDDSQFVESVRAGLRDGHGEVLVAALWVCATLCRDYVWPGEKLDDTLALAVAAADRILLGRDDFLLRCVPHDAEQRARVEGFRRELADRLPKRG